MVIVDISVLGILARYDFGSTMASRPYIDGSARLGKNYNRYENTHMINRSTGEHAKYDMSTNYFGIHVGAGYEFKIYNQALDIYAKYLYNNLDGFTYFKWCFCYARSWSKYRC